MPDPIDLSRRNFLTGSGSRSTVAAPTGGFRLDLSERCLAYRNIVCEACRDACEPNAFRFRPRIGAAPRPTIDAERCTGCGDCIGACPANALKLSALRNEDDEAGDPRYA